MLFRTFYYSSIFILLSIQWANAQVSLSVRYGKGIVDDIVTINSQSSFYSEQSLGEDDFALALQVPISKKWGLSLQTEVELQTKRYQQIIPISQMPWLENMPNIYYKVQYKNFQLPFIVRKDFKLGSKLGMYMMGGLWLISGTLGIDHDDFYEGEVYTPKSTFIYTFPGDMTLTLESKDTKIAERQLDSQKFGTHILLGTGVTYQLNRFRLGLEYRYTKRQILPSNLQTYQSANIFLTYLLSKQHEK